MFSSRCPQAFFLVRGVLNRGVFSQGVLKRGVLSRGARSQPLQMCRAFGQRGWTRVSDTGRIGQAQVGSDCSRLMGVGKEQGQFRCSCKIPTAYHGKDGDRNCKLFGMHGVLRYAGYDMGLSKDDVEEVCSFWPPAREWK